MFGNNAEYYSGLEKENTIYKPHYREFDYVIS